MVKKELDLVETDSTVYKLIGPCLIKQDPDEARNTVAKRIEYLAGEMYVTKVATSHSLSERDWKPLQQIKSKR
jgi:chaperonin cofactor prefoldin